MKYFIPICILIGICNLLTNCEEKEFKFVLGTDNKYTFDLSGPDEFNDDHLVTSDDLIEMTEDLDDDVRQNAHQLEIEYVKANILGNPGNSANSVTLSVSIDWNNDSTDIDILFTKLTVPVAHVGDDYVLITDLTRETIDLLSNKFYNAVRLTDVTPFTIRAAGTLDNGTIDALLTIVIKASVVTSKTDDYPKLILKD